MHTERMFWKATPSASACPRFLIRNALRQVKPSANYRTALTDEQSHLLSSNRNCVSGQEGLPETPSNSAGPSGLQALSLFVPQFLEGAHRHRFHKGTCSASPSLSTLLLEHRWANRGMGGPPTGLCCWTGAGTEEGGRGAGDRFPRWGPSCLSPGFSNLRWRAYSRPCALIR